MLLFLFTYFPTIIRGFRCYFKIEIPILLNIFFQEGKCVPQRREAIPALTIFFGDAEPQHLGIVGVSTAESAATLEKLASQSVKWR